MPTAETHTENLPRDEEMHTKLDGLAERFTKIKKISEDYQASLEYTQEEVKDLKEENTHLRSTIEELTLEVQRNTYAIQKMGTRQESLEILAKKKNLIFEGVPENQGGRENFQDTVCAILSEMGITKSIDFEAAYRIGMKPGKYPRPFSNIFSRQDDRNVVFSCRTNLRKSRHFSRVWVSEDVTARTRRTRNILREVAKEVRNDGARCLATPSSVTINDRKYTEENLDELPPKYAVDKIKMKKMGDTIGYGSEHAPLSNLYPVHVPYKKRNYLSSEQAFRHTRAMENEYHNVAARILWSRDPYDIIELDRNLTFTKEWEKKEDLVLFKCMFRKIEANEDSGNSPRHWGFGAGRSD